MISFKIKNNSLGWLRLFGFFEGMSLLILMLFAMPMKYIWNDPSYVRLVGSMHGALFVLFIIQIYIVMRERNWDWNDIPLKLFISCFIPFGTFYLDFKILSKLDK